MQDTKCLACEPARTPPCNHRGTDPWWWSCCTIVYL